MLVLSTNEPLTTNNLRDIHQALTRSPCRAVVLPVFNRFANRPTLARMLETSGIRVIAAKYINDAIYCARTPEEMAQLIDDRHPIPTGPRLRDDNGYWRLDDDTRLPEWKPGDPLPTNLDLEAPTLATCLGWTNAYITVRPFRSSELLDLRRRLRSSTPATTERLNHEFKLLQRNTTQVRIVNDAAAVVSVLRKQSIPRGVGRGSAMASQLCYSLGLTRAEPPADLAPVRFYDNTTRTPDIDLNVSAKRRAEVLGLLHDEFNSAGLIVINKNGATSAHPSAVSLHPLAIASKGLMPFTADDAKVLGIPIVDVLGSRVVDQITDVVDKVPVVDMSKIANLWPMLNSGYTYGLPEIGTHYGQELMRKFKPQSRSDLERVVALIRPGAAAAHATPQNYRTIPLFQEDAITELTNVGITQEDALATVNAVAKGAPVPDITIPDDASEVYERIAGAGYLFSRAHAYAYTLQIMALAIRRQQYPAEYVDATSPYVADSAMLATHVAASLGLRVTKPLINQTPLASAVHDDELRLGLASCMDATAAQQVVELRNTVPFAEAPADFERRLGFAPPCAIGA